MTLTIAEGPCPLTDGEKQAFLDLADAEKRLRRLAKLREIVDHEKGEVERLTRELKGAQHRLKEAGWNLAATERAVSLYVSRLPEESPPAPLPLPAPNGRKRKGPRVKDG